MKFLFIIFLILSSFLTTSSFAQQLSITETILYINNSLNNSKDNTCILFLNNDGILEFNRTTLEYTLGLNGGGINGFYNYQIKYKSHISEIEPSNLFTRNSKETSWNDIWSFNIVCKGKAPLSQSYSNDPTEIGFREKCIQKIVDKSTSNVSSFYISSKDGDKYSTQKLLNAVTYLFSLAHEEGLDKRNDNDDFAPKNFNPIKNEIVSLKNDGKIKLELSQGIYYVSVYLGNSRKKFVLDSGASDVLISEDLEDELLKLGMINKANYLSPALYKIADGSIVSSRRLILPELKIGGFKVKNVRASIGVGPISLLLGKSFLDKFKSWKIDNQDQTLNLEK